MDFRRGSLDSGLSGSSGETLVPRLPPLDPVHQMFERVLHKTLSQKQREVIRPWEAASDGAGHQHSLLSLRPLAQSQPVLTSCGKGAVPGTRCTLRRVAITNSMSDHLEETWGPSDLRAPGLKYLEQVCRLLDRIADLQERNSLLKEDKLQLEKKLRQKEKQQELLQHYCSCGSAAWSLGDHSLHGFKHSPHLTHKSTTPSQRQPQHLLEHSRRYSHISFQKRWASDPDKVHEANVGSGFQMDEHDSRQYRSQDHLASRVHRETFHNNTAQAGKHRWDGVRDVLHRLTGKSKRRGKFKGLNHHNPRWPSRASGMEEKPQ